MKLRLRLLPLLLGPAFVVAGPAVAQNLLPNPGFELGADRPEGWRLVDKSGAWVEASHQGRRALLVEGKGDDSAAWRTEKLRFAAGSLYHLSFQARRDPAASGGCAVAGSGRVNRDFQYADDWQPYGFTFAVPTDGAEDFVRLGEWNVKGRVFYDDAELLPVQATHRSFENTVELGEGERIEPGRYRFAPQFGWAGANYHRPLWANRASFNSDRWVFYGGAEVVYRFALTGLTQTNAQVHINLNYHVAGQLRVEASRDGKSWQTVGSFDGKRRNGTNSLPAEFFPAGEIFVRLTAPDAAANLQVNTIDYEAALREPVQDAMGHTCFLLVQQKSPELEVKLSALNPNAGPKTMEAAFWLTNLSRAPVTFRGGLTSSGDQRATAKLQNIKVGEVTRCVLTAAVEKPGVHLMELRFTDKSGRLLFAGRTEASRSYLSDPRPGYLLGGNGQLVLWWCESGWKIGREARPPAQSRGSKRPVAVSLARGEYETAQVVITPLGSRQTTLRSAQVAPWKGKGGSVAPITVELAEVAYVHVTQPTDSSCERGWYPDPLPPLRTPFALPSGNQPIWLTFFVSREARAGDYTSELTLKTDAGELSVPLKVHVYDFEMPRDTHLRSALGLGRGEINRYHKLASAADKEAVFEKYLENFAAHRISPYSFFDHAPIDVRFEGQGSDKRAKVDFTRFDRAAAKWLDEYRFNSFLLPLRGMGGGTFHSRHLGELEGFNEGTPEHARLFKEYLGQIERHLRDRGWLDKAYTYWFDEPDPKDYAFVVAGMQRIKAAAPGLKRMLTEQPEPELLEHVEIWCGLTPEWTTAKVDARRAAGQEVWWYICCAPKSPYVTEFIDHPGTELRLWPWQSWQHGVQGILIWETLYWSSSSAFPPPQLQNPWTDPMSYVSGYDYKPGQIAYWGNGDGRFLYPPRRDPVKSTEPCLDGPINSVRWDSLRDGMEDYEYFWLLQREVDRLVKAQGDTQIVRQARALLKVPEAVSRDLTHFTTDPRVVLDHRDRLALAIERLQKIGRR